MFQQQFISPMLLKDATTMWQPLKTPPSELRLDVTLVNGQSFIWQLLPQSFTKQAPLPSTLCTEQELWEDYVGVIGPHAVILRQTPDDIYFLRLGTSIDRYEQLLPKVQNEVKYSDCELNDSLRNILLDYFYLSVGRTLFSLPLDSLPPVDFEEPSQYATFLESIPNNPLSAKWASIDPLFSALSKAIPGMRMLRQDPLECLFSFIFSSNNNIQRITSSLLKLRALVGNSIGTLQLKSFPTNITEDTIVDNGEAYWEFIAAQNVQSPFSSSSSIRSTSIADSPSTAFSFGLYTFPRLSALARLTEDQLREIGSGYRARYVTETVKILEKQGGESWLYSLREQNQVDAINALTTLSGVGRKVASCIALFSLDKSAVVPVDTHVLKLAMHDYQHDIAVYSGLVSGSMATFDANIGPLPWNIPSGADGNISREKVKSKKEEITHLLSDDEVKLALRELLRKLYPSKYTSTDAKPAAAAKLSKISDLSQTAASPLSSSINKVRFNIVFLPDFVFIQRHVFLILFGFLLVAKVILFLSLLNPHRLALLQSFMKVLADSFFLNLDLLQVGLILSCLQEILRSTEREYLFTYCGKWAELLLRMVKYQSSSQILKLQQHAKLSA